MIQLQTTARLCRWREQALGRFDLSGNDVFVCEVGASSGSPPSGYNIDRTRIQIGKGELVWGRAVVAVRRLQMFNIRRLRLCWPDSPMAAGTNVAVVVHHFGFWSLNACRVV